MEIHWVRTQHQNHRPFEAVPYWEEALTVVGVGLEGQQGTPYRLGGGVPMVIWPEVELDLKKRRMTCH